MNEHVAFIGVGRMGGRMTRRLLDAGYPVSVYDPDAKAVEVLIARGAIAAGSPAEAVTNARFILTSLPNPQTFTEVVLGEQGVLVGAEPPSLIIDLGTGDPATARRVSDVASQHGIGFLDCPVSRGVVGAENGTLALMVGGTAAHLEDARPLLEHLGTDIVHVGDVGAGQVTKLCNNMLTAIITTGLGEVLVTGVKAGVQLEALAAALSGGSASNFVLTGYLPNTLFTSERKPGFALSLMDKDLGLFMRLADKLEIDLPLAELVRERCTYAKDEAALGDADFTSIAELYERAGRVRLQLAPAEA